MARAKVIHSEDSCMILLEGDKRNPEPSECVIKFPGGFVQVARCSDGTYWAHIEVEKTIQHSRIDYNYEGWAATEGMIPDVPHADKIQHIAVRI